MAPDVSATGDVTQDGQIRAASAALTAAGGNVYALAGNRQGLIEATGTTTIGGQVWLGAPNGAVQAAGAVTARNADGSGGQIVVAGAKSTLVSGTLDASGTQGGQVLVGVTAPQTGLSDSTTIADGAVIRAGGPGGGGQVETSGHTLSLGAAQIDTAGGHWLLDPTDLTIDSTAASTVETALATTNVTLQTTAGAVGAAGVASSTGVQASGTGNLTVASAINWSSANTLTLTAYNSLAINAAVTNSGTGGLTLSAGGALTTSAAVALTGGAFSATTAAGGMTIGNTVSARTVSLTAGGGNLTLNAAVTGSAANANAVLLNTTGNFINNAGAGAVQATGSGGYWRIYSTDPTLDTPGGLAPNFYQYGVANNGAVNGSASGDGLIYSAVEVLSYSLTDSALNHVAKTYDGTAAIAAGGITAANISASGLVSGDSIAPITGAGTYSQSNAGASLTVTLTGGVAVTHGSAAVYGYAAGTQLNQGVIGSITPAAATVNLVGALGKTYDGSAAANLTSGNFSVGGLVAGQTITVGQPASASYDSANAAATRTLSVTLSPTSYVAGSGVSLSNYVLPTTLTATNVVITPAPLTISGVVALDKVYDRTSAATLNLSNIAFSGYVNASDVSLVTTGASAAFTAGANVGSNLAVTVSGISLANGATLASNYTVVQPTGLTASITAAPLTISGLTAVSRTYNGTTAAALTGTAGLNGVISGDVLTLGGAAAGAFASKNVGSGIAVSVSGLTVSGTNSADYSLFQPTGLTANITQAPLTVSLSGSINKTYDGTNVATINPANFTFSGLVSGESVTVGQTASATYASANASATAQAIAIGLAQSDFTAGSGTSLTNYALPTTTANTPKGLINKAPLQIYIVNNPTKTYDGTNTATLASTNYQFSGLVGGETATVSQTAGTYASSNAGAWTVTANVSGDVFGTNGFTLSNYSLPTIVTGPGLINPAPLSLGGSSPYNLNVGIVGNPTKVYNGLTSIFLASSNFNLQGLQNGDSITVNPTTGTLGSANAGVDPISVALQPNATSYSAAGGALLTNYVLPTVAYGQGTVTRAPVTVSIVGDPTKTYDASTYAALSNGNFSFSGLVGSDAVTIGQVSSATYDSANAGARTITAILAASDFTAAGATRLANYTFNGATPDRGVVSVTGAGTINPAVLTVLNASANSKTYDQTNAATINAGTLYGVVAGQNVTLVQSSTGVFSGVDVGSNLTVTPTAAYSLSGAADLNNYTLIQPTLTANINRLALTIATISANNKPYDGTTAATVTASGLTGVLTALRADSVSLDASGYTATFKNANAASNIQVTASGFGLTGAQANDYSLIQPSGLTANITKAVISASIINDPTKTYDGSTLAALTSANYLLTGWAAGQGADVTVVQQTSANYNSKNATANGGATSVTATLAAPDFHDTVTNLANYQLPTTATGAGAINTATLIAQIVNDPTKTYDGTMAFNALSTGDFKILGWATGEGSDVTVTKASATSATQNAGVTTLSTTLAPTDFSAIVTSLGNYTLPTAASGGGTINPRALTISLAGQTKTYDGTTTAAGLTAGSFTLGNFVGGDGGTLTGVASGTYNSKDVSTATTVTATGIVIGDVAGAGGFLASNYSLPSSVSGAGVITPATLTLGAVTRVYDGGNLIDDAAHAVTYTLSGLLGSDTATINPTGVSGTYTATTHVGSGLNVSLTGVALASNPGGDYTIASTQTGDFGAITPKTITGSLAAQTKVYDGTTTASGLTPADFTLNGFVAGQGATVGATTGAYNAKDVTATTVTVSGLTPASYSPTGATQLTDYSLPTSISGPGTITAAPLTVSLSSITKVYDGTTSLPTASSGYVLGGVIGSDVVDVASAAGSYNSQNVGASIGVNVLSVTLGGANAFDYTVQLPAANAPIGFITPAALTLNIVNAPSKAYDGSTSVVVGGASILTASDYSIAGVVAADAGFGVGVNGGSADLFIDPTFNSKNVNVAGHQAGAVSITATGVGWGDLSFGAMTAGQIAQFETNYGLSGTATGAASITPVTVTGGVNSQSKTYDGTSAALGLTAASYVLNGFVNGESAKVTRTGGIYFNAGGATINTDATTVKVGAGSGSAALTASDYVDAGSTGFSYYNYVMPTSLSGAGAIAAKLISLASVTKVYDGTGGVAGLGAGAYALTGVLGADSSNVQINTGAIAWDGTHNGAFNSVNVATGIPMYLQGVALTGSAAGDYAIASTVSGATIGAITPAALTLSFTGNPTKTYDGTTGLTGLTGANFLIGGLVHGETASLDVTSGSYGGPNVQGTNGSIVNVAGIASGNYVAGSGGLGTTFLASNYSLPTSVTGTGTITPAALTLSIIGSPTKVYDGTSAATLTAANYAIGGLIGTQTSSINITAGAYNSPDVLTASLVTVGGVSAGSFNPGANGFLVGNYAFPTTISGAGTITPAALIGTLAAQTKVYDGTTTALGLTAASYNLSGFIGSQSATVDLASGAYNNANVVGATTVTVGGIQAADYIPVNGFIASNYALPTAISGAGTITAKSLTATIVPQSKTYDGATTASGLTAASYDLSGFVGSQTATLNNHASGTYDSANVASATTVTVAGVVSGDYAGANGFINSNYALPTSVSGTGTITPAALTLSIIGSPTKVYDGTSAATLTAANYAIGGLIGTQTSSINITAGAYNSPDVLTASLVTVGGVSAGSFNPGANGFLVGNYAFPTTISGAGTITPAALIGTLAAQTKVYDGTTTALGLTAASYNLSGFIGSQSATVDLASGAYNNANVVGATTVTVGGIQAADYIPVNGFIASNYALPTAISGAGTITAKSLTATIVPQSKTYDGATTASGLTAASYDLSGFVGSQTATLNNHASGTYDSANVASATTVTVAGVVSGDYAGANGFINSNYALPTSVSGTGTITPAALTGTLAAQTKVYDATTTAAGLTPAMFVLSGFVGSQSATVTGETSGLYNSKDVLSANTVTVSGVASSNYVGANGFINSNYALPTTIAGPGAITPAPLFVADLGVLNKVYDGATAAQLDLSKVTSTSLQGVFAGDNVILSALPGSAAFATPNVGAGIQVTLNGQSIGGADVGDYTLSSTALATANITPRPLTAAIVGTPTKTYDGTTVATLSSGNFALTGFVSGQGATVTQTVGTYDAPDAASRTVTAVLTGGAFTGLGSTLLTNYALPTIASGPGLINPALLTVSIVGDPTKLFDGTTAAALTPANFQIGGFFGSDGATITTTTGAYGTVGPGPEIVTAQLTSGAYAPSGATKLSNYLLPLSATGVGAIVSTANADLFGRYEEEMLKLGLTLSDPALELIRETQYTMATPRLYIPFPAPGALSTFKGNGFASLPIVVDQTTAYASVTGDDGGVATQSGPPMINTTEQALLQGVRSKQYRIMAPSQAAAGPGLAGG